MPLPRAFRFMTLTEIVYEVQQLGVKSSRTLADSKNFVNRAIRRVAQRRNWTCLHDIRTATMPSGSNEAPLDPNFKALSSEKSPVSYQDPTTSMTLPIPCEVTSRALSTRMGYNPFVAISPAVLNTFPLRYVYIEQNAGGRWTLFLPQQYQTNPTSVVFTISAYYYPETLVLGDDSNGITNHPELCDAVINLAKHLAYAAEEVDNPKADAALSLYERAYKSAAYSDVAQQFSGRQLQM